MKTAPILRLAVLLLPLALCLPAAATPPRQVLSEQAPNVQRWAVAGLGESEPPELRVYLQFLREDLLDEAAKAGDAAKPSYQAGAKLCDALLGALKQRETALDRAGLLAARNTANRTRTNQAIEARRNYLMSWTQLERERDQRAALGQQQDSVENSINADVRAAWKKEAAATDGKLTNCYQLYREALRKDPGFGLEPDAGTGKDIPVPLPKPEPPINRPADPVPAKPPLDPKQNPPKPQATPPLPNPTPGGIGDLGKYVKGRQFDCRDGRLTDLRPLANMSLTKVDCAGSNVSDLTPLRNVKGLATVNCGKTAVVDLSPLRGMPLNYLCINATRVTDLTPLSGMPLTTLSCKGTAVTDLAPLRTMRKLKILDCDFVAERDTAILRSISSLEKINGSPANDFWKQAGVGNSPKQRKR